MANGMASLYVGTTGLKSAQTALNTTAHNLANINTTGYTRQQVTFSDTQYVKMGANTSTTSVSTYGLGVTVSEIRRIRDQFIDSAYRSENSRLGYYKSQYNAVEEVEDLFGEMQGVTYQSTLTNLYDSINELSKNPSSTVARASLIQNATAFIERTDSIYSGLTMYQNTLNTQVSNMVTNINDLGNTIYTLNKKIAKIEAAGVEDANDYRDQRDAALDELSGYINIDYYETDNGETMVTAEGVPFVTVTSVSEMSSRRTEEAGLLIPTWPGYGRDVYTAGMVSSNVSDTDKGELKGLLEARGSIAADYTDVPVRPETSDYDMTTTEGVESYNKAYKEYQDKQDYYNANIEPSVILSAIVGLDKLVNGIVESINNVFCPEKQVTTTVPMTDASGKDIQADEYEYTSTASVLYDKMGNTFNGTDNGDGTYSYNTEVQLYSDPNKTNKVAADSYTYSILDMDKTSYGMDDDKTVGEELFSRTATDRYVTTTDANGNKIYVRNNLNGKENESLYTIGNITINNTVAQNVGKLALSTIQGKEDFDAAQKLVDVWSEEFASLNPEQYAKADFGTFYNNFISEFATAGSVLDNYVSNQTTMVGGYDSQRLQTEGVSSDEELEKLVKYQQAYNAASRYVNVVSQMLEHLVTSLGS